MACTRGQVQIALRTLRCSGQVRGRPAAAAVQSSCARASGWIALRNLGLTATPASLQHLGVGGNDWRLHAAWIAQRNPGRRHACLPPRHWHTGLRWAIQDAEHRAVPRHARPAAADVQSSCARASGWIALRNLGLTATPASLQHLGVGGNDWRLHAAWIAQRNPGRRHACLPPRHWHTGLRWAIQDAEHRAVPRHARLAAEVELALTSRRWIAHALYKG